MNTKRFILTSLLLMVFNVISSYAQETKEKEKEEGAFAQKQDPEAVVDEDVMSYHKAIESSAIIYVGKDETSFYKYPLKNTPYLDTDEFRKGIVSFDGRIYPDIMLRLNLNREELVVRSPDGAFNIVIPKERIDYAFIDSLLIYYHQPIAPDGIILPEGFYIRVHDGKYQVWKRDLYSMNIWSSRAGDLAKSINEKLVYIEGMQKSYEESIRPPDEYYIFYSKMRLFVVKEGIYYPVKNKRSLLNLFATKKKELKTFIRRSELIFRKEPEKTVIAVINYVNELNK